MLEQITPTRIGWAIAAVGAALLIRFLQQGIFYRRLVRKLPGPPHSWTLGHLGSMGRVLAISPKRTAPQYFPYLVQQEYNLGDYFYLDVWPTGGPILVITDADLMDQCTVKHSSPKHEYVREFMVHLGGPGNLVSSEGQEWKKWRSAFNPGFSTSNLMTLVPAIVDDCKVFCDIMTQYAKSGQVFRMEPVATRLTVDVIGKVVLDLSLNSQRGSNELVDAFMQQVRWSKVGVQFNPWEAVDFRRPFVRAYLTWRMNRYIGAKLDERFASRASRSGKSKAIIDLALEAYMKEVKGTTDDMSQVKKLDAEFRTAAISNMKVFIFAGHDTTSSTICYVYYYLSKNPAMLAKIRAEHDDVFGTDPSTVASQLKADPRLINRLEYTLAVTREVLRMQPPASTIREGERGFFLHDPKTGEALPTEHCMIWPVDVGLHRNSKYWPDPHVFNPERYLGSSAESSANNSKDAWVAFSKGRRNCIGQELAIIETKVIVAMTIRSFDFEAAFDALDLLKGDGSAYPSDMSGVQDVLGEEAYQIQLGTAKPREGMPCRIRLRSQ